MMEERLRAYIEELFAEAPASHKAMELKEEMTQNLIDKYHDLLSEGKPEDVAFNIAVSGIGDVSGLLRDLENDGFSPERAAYERRRMISAALTALAIMLYILSIIPVLLFDEMGVVAMFVLIALATGLLIFNNMTKPKYYKTDDTVVEDFRAWQYEKAGKNSMQKAISSALWSVTVVIYLVLSFTTRAWSLTWILFPLAGAVENIIRIATGFRK